MVVALGVAPPPAAATFHFMQIEQVIGGVDGNPDAQAVQLRTRRPAQHEVSKSRLIAWDAAGENPIVVLDFESDVASTAEGTRILVATEVFARYTAPGAVADFIMTEPIPEAYLAAGSLTFENDDETLIVWRFSWGGADYTGPTGGALTNDDNGDFGPPFPTVLPADGLQALQFLGQASALSQSNDVDYTLTPDAAVFINNAGEAFTVMPLDCPEGPDGDSDHDGLCACEDNCPEARNPNQVDFDRDGFGDACDGCPGDPGKVEPGVCGCGVSDADDDGDGAPDCPGGTMPDGNGGDTDDGGANDGGSDGPGDGDDGGSDDMPGTSPPSMCGAGMVPLFPLFFIGLRAVRRGGPLR